MTKSCTNFLIVHGTLGSPDSHWFPWFQHKLKAAGHNVIVPLFPTPEDQSFSSWFSVAERALQGIDLANTVLIGHSIGAIFALRLAENASSPYRAVFAICPFMRALGLEPFDTLNATFVQHTFDWPRIRKNAGEVICFAGKDDPYVPLSCATEVARLSGATLTVIEKGGHLNAESGTLEFPLLLDKMRQTKLV